MKIKRILSVFLCAILILPAYSAGAFVPDPVFDVESLTLNEQTDPQKEVTFIVEIEGDPVLAGEKAGPEKLKKAESLGVTVIGEAEFRALVGGEIPDQAGNDERKDRNDGMMEIKGEGTLF